MALLGRVTFASFTCQPRRALKDHMEENQRFWGERYRSSFVRKSPILGQCDNAPNTALTGASRADDAQLVAFEIG
jgi:hypothetical protein